MGRRISIHRPNAKVRGVKRRLRALDKWAESFAGHIPYLDDRYHNYKIPVLDRLVEGPTATSETQKAALKSLLKAAAHLAKNNRARDWQTGEIVKPEYYRVAVLMNLPDMFSSEVTVFYDRDYYNTFYRDGRVDEGMNKPSELFGIELPNGFVECGAIAHIPYEDDDGEEHVFTSHGWTIGQPL